MSQYARMNGEEIYEILDLDDSWYQDLVASGNPKAQIFRMVVSDQIPSYNQVLQVLEESLIVEPTQIRRTYSVRNKTQEEIAVERKRTWTSFQFLQRFTEQELDNVRDRTSTDPICWRFLILATSAQEVNNDDPVTLAGMDYLVGVNLITQQRRNEILDLP